MSKKPRTRQKLKAAAKRKRSKSFWIFGSIVFMTVIASAYALTHSKASPQLIAKLFPAHSINSDQELEKMAQEKDGDIDLALANWLAVADIPEFQNLTREDYFEQLHTMIEQVKEKMTSMQAANWPTANSDDPQTRCQRFCSAMIRLHFKYAEQFQEENLIVMQRQAMYSNPDNIFFAGLLRTRQGTCVSMPLIYLVIGQRLNMPVHFVEIGMHYFIRWDEPGFRMDIETTITTETAWTRDESVYLDTEGMTHDQLQGSDLRNLTNREVIGELLYARTSYWHVKGAVFEGNSHADLILAHKFAPDDPGIERLYHAVFNHPGIILKQNHQS